MYQASAEFEKAILGSSRTFRAKIGVNGKEITSGIRSVQLYARSCAEDSIGIGGAVAAYAVVEMVQPDQALENQEICLSIGLLLEDKVEWVPMGLFTVQKPEAGNGQIQFTAYDRIQSKMGGAYFSELEYPADGKKVLEEISQKTGAPIKTDNLPDGISIQQRKVVSESGTDDDGNPTTNTTYANPFDGYTYQEALGYIAQLYGKFAVADRNGNVVFRWYEDADRTINPAQYYDDLVMQETVCAITGISCQAGEETLTAGTGKANIQCENPVMTQERLNAVFEQVKDLEFLPAGLSFLGDIRLDVGDIITVNDRKGNVLRIPVMYSMQDYDGGVLTQIRSFGGTDTENTASVKGPTAQKLDRTYTDLFLVKQILGNKANFDYVRAAKAELDEAIVKKLSAEQADLKYAKIDFTNIDTAAMEYFYAQSGLIKDVTVGDGTITGHLVGVTISGDLIEGNTIKAEKLVIKGEDGLYYKLNVSGEGTSAEQTDYNSLNGSVLQAKSVTAEKVSVKDLVAFGATIGGFRIGDHNIHSMGKDTVHNIVHGIYMDDNGQIALGDGDNYIKYYKDSDGKWKLAISIDELTIGSSGSKVGEELDNIKQDLKDQIADVREEISTLLRLESSRGTVFKNDQVSTVLSVVIYHGKQRITDAETMHSVFGAGAYLQWKWQRLGDEGYGIISASDSRFGNDGFTFTLSPDDVDTKITFMCELIV